MTELDISRIELPGARELSLYRQITGSGLSFGQRGDGASLSARDVGSLTLDTEIEHRGGTDSFGSLLLGMKSGATMRCQTPFRESSSEAAFIKRTSHVRYGEGGFLHDVGTSTSYFLARDGGTPGRAIGTRGDEAVIGCDEDLVRSAMARFGIGSGLVWKYGWILSRHLKIPAGLKRARVVHDGTAAAATAADAMARRLGAAAVEARLSYRPTMTPAASTSEAVP